MGNKHGKQQQIDPQYLKVSGLYSSCDWDEKVLKRLILDRKLAPCYPGTEDVGDRTDLEECPICFLHYPGGLNRSACCLKPICTECYLQIRCNVHKEDAACPFCKFVGYKADYKGALSQDERRKTLEEEQKVIELQIELQKKERATKPTHPQASPHATSQPVSMQSPESEGAGSSFDGGLASSPHEVFLGDDNIRERWNSANAELQTEAEHSSILTSNILSRSPPRMEDSIIQHSTGHRRHPLEGMEVDMEEMMLMEAIRQSLAEHSSESSGQEPAPAPASHMSERQQQVTANAALQLEQLFARGQPSNEASSSNGSPRSDEPSSHLFQSGSSPSSIPDDFEAQLQLALALSLSDSYAGEAQQEEREEGDEHPEAAAEDEEGEEEGEDGQSHVGLEAFVVDTDETEHILRLARHLEQPGSWLQEGEEEVEQEGEEEGEEEQHQRDEGGEREEHEEEGEDGTDQEEAEQGEGAMGEEEEEGGEMVGEQERELLQRYEQTELSTAEEVQQELAEIVVDVQEEAEVVHEEQQQTSSMTATVTAVVPAAALHEAQPPQHVGTAQSTLVEEVAGIIPPEQELLQLLDAQPHTAGVNAIPMPADSQPAQGRSSANGVAEDQGGMHSSQGDFWGTASVANIGEVLCVDSNGPAETPTSTSSS